MKKIQQILTLLVLVFTSFAAAAQDVAAVPVYAPYQLDQMLAPIALYPDPLVAQILMASTYPLEIVEAERWMRNPANAGLQGDELADALAQQPWDPSVKSLVPFPQVMQTLNQNLEWTEQLGNAFLAQQADVMNAIQNLRYDAEQSGVLRSTPQQVVTTQGSYILIQPANPAILYVPYYNPAVVYGTWPYADYPPYYFSGSSIAVGVGLGFFGGLAIIAPLWDWHHWDWHDHRIVIDDRRFASLDEGHPPPRPGFWQHDPAHRHGVPYTNPAVRTHFSAENHPAPSAQNFRGYEGHAEVSPGVIHGGSRPGGSFDAHEQTHFEPQHSEQHSAEPQVTHAMPAAVPQMHEQPQSLRPAPQAQPQHVSAPMFDSFSRGQDVHQQQIRGAQSREAPASPSHASSPPPQQHPAAGGGHPGGDDHERH